MTRENLNRDGTSGRGERELTESHRESYLRRIGSSLEARICSDSPFFLGFGFPGSVAGVEALAAANTIVLAFVFCLVSW